MCGLLTGGSDECWWDCHVEKLELSYRLGFFRTFIPDPSCLTDCYPADHCLSLLLADYQAAGGICRGSYLDVFLPGLFPVSNKTCKYYNSEDCECTVNDYLNNVCSLKETIAKDCWWWEVDHEP